MICIVVLTLLISRGRLEQIRTVDALSLFAAGACAGASRFGIELTKSR